MIPKGLDLSGSRGDELLSMLEAIGTEGKQLRQELNEAKAREDFLTKKVLWIINFYYVISRILTKKILFCCFLFWIQVSSF